MFKLSLSPLILALSRVAQTSTRLQKQIILVTLDSLILFLSMYGSFALRKNSLTVNIAAKLGLTSLESALFVGTFIAIQLLIFRTTNVYRLLLRHIGLELFTQLGKTSLINLAVLVILESVIPIDLPHNLLILNTLLSFGLMGMLRIGLKHLLHDLSHYPNQTMAEERVVIYGAGAAGSHLAQALLREKGYRPVAFVDDNTDLHHHTIHQFRVHPSDVLPVLKERQTFDSVLLAMPSATERQRQQICDRLQSLNVPIRTLPSLGEILSGQTTIRPVRELDQPIDIDALLGRNEIPAQEELLQRNITDKVVLVTGAGGSIGSELCRQIAQQGPRRLVLFELSEFALYQIDLELAEQYPQVERVACLGSVTDQERLTAVLQQHRVETLYHAAAYKHVPMVEINAAQGVLNNVFGTMVAARSALQARVKNFVLISTDKAVRPTNVMGATKRSAELVIQALAKQSNQTCFTIVRFGNVLGSSGSVVPRFRQQIAMGGPITLTHQDITRYFMSIPEAARLVIQAGAMSRSGDVFLLNMGQPVRIYDLASQMIRLSGLEPERDIAIAITGLRPGEKLYEELLIDSAKATPTQHPKIFSAYEAMLPWEVLQLRLLALCVRARCNDHAGILIELQRIVPEFQPKPMQPQGRVAIAHAPASSALPPATPTTLPPSGPEVGSGAMSGPRPVPATPAPSTKASQSRQPALTTLSTVR
jgi:FlaA1/EpsC-like NDP-sugar epimerase